uniref:Uncharacterized protein n=1 Tax=Bracon brevicornis TaxID=1563983 RepID=A0A6V7JY23_9HYME
MYVMESGGNRVAPALKHQIKKVDYKTTNDGHTEHVNSGGTNLAATVKDTVRRLLRRTKSHRDTPSVYPTSITSTSKNTKPTKKPMDKVEMIPRKKRFDHIDSTAPPPPPAPSSQYSSNRANTGAWRRNHTKLPQVRVLNFCLTRKNERKKLNNTV